MNTKIEYIIPDITARNSLDSFNFNEKFNNTLWTSQKTWQGRTKIGVITTKNSIIFKNALKLGYKIIKLDKYLEIIHKNEKITRVIIQMDDNRDNIPVLTPNLIKEFK